MTQLFFRGIIVIESEDNMSEKDDNIAIAAAIRAVAKVLGEGLAFIAVALFLGLVVNGCFSGS